jgi:hypothetical protein
MRSRIAAVIVVGAALLAALMPSPAFAAQPARPAGSTAAVATGSDISWAQCGRRLPSGQAFGIVNANGGTAASFNPCLSTEVAWAQATSGTTPQPRLAFYVNTANPYGQGSWWPKSDSDRPPTGASPYPTGQLPAATVSYPSGKPVGCTTTDGTVSGPPSYNGACAYVYGYVRAEQAVEWVHEQVPRLDLRTYRWWLDVETTNTWQTDTRSNAASLAGAAAYLAQAGLGVGAYSTTAQWTSIVGGTGASIPALPSGDPNNLIGLDEWGAGASSQKGAVSNCTAAKPFTGGSNRLMQYVANGTDYDVSCAGY